MFLWKHNEKAKFFIQRTKNFIAWHLLYLGRTKRPQREWHYNRSIFCSFNVSEHQQWRNHRKSIPPKHANIPLWPVIDDVRDIDPTHARRLESVLPEMRVLPSNGAQNPLFDAGGILGGIDSSGQFQWVGI